MDCLKYLSIREPPLLAARWWQFISFHHIHNEFISRSYVLPPQCILHLCLLSICNAPITSSLHDLNIILPCFLVSTLAFRGPFTKHLQSATQSHTPDYKAPSLNVSKSFPLNLECPVFLPCKLFTLTFKPFRGLDPTFLSRNTRILFFYEQSKLVPALVAVYSQFPLSEKTASSVHLMAGSSWSLNFSLNVTSYRSPLLTIPYKVLLSQQLLCIASFNFVHRIYRSLKLRFLLHETNLSQR